MAKPKPRIKKTPACAGIATFFNLPYEKTLEDVDFVMAGVPFDTLTTFRPGTRFGPRALRAAYGSAMYNAELDVEVFEQLSGSDYGDLEVQTRGNSVAAFNIIKEEVAKIASAGVTPIMVGGDHSIAYPELMGYKEAIGKVAICHFDSHSDTGYSPKKEDAPFNHGTPFRDAMDNDCIITEHSVQVGMRGITGPISKNYHVATEAGMTVIPADTMHDIGIDETAKRMREVIGDAPVFVTFDIDFLDPMYAPGTGTPEGCGFSTWEGLELIRKSLIGKNIIGFDLVEVNPMYDYADITALAGKRILAEFLGLMAARKAGITQYKGFGGNEL